MACESNPAEIGVAPSRALALGATPGVSRNLDPAPAPAHRAFGLPEVAVAGLDLAAARTVATGYHLAGYALTTHKLFPYDFIIGRGSRFGKVFHLPPIEFLP